jgi:sortase A
MVKTKTLAAWLLLGVGASVFGVTLAQATLVSPVEPEIPIVEAPATPAQTADKPARLRIASLGVDAHVQHVGVGKSGNMAVPSNYSDAGWYRYGTTPGFRGSAVLDGHVDNGLSLPGVFARLNELKPGDAIEVESASGEVKTFVVEEVVVYPYRDVPLQKVFNRDDTARLNLVTCEGAWIHGEKTYDHRLVVYATLDS